MHPIPLADAVPDDVIAALRDLGAATVYEAQGAIGALSSAIKPLDPVSLLAGRALTVDAAAADNLVIHHALTKARPGDVIVIDAKGYAEAGPWGDVLTEAAMVRGVAGLVINGAVRDSAAIVRMGFPAFCRAVSIKATGKTQSGTVGEPITIDGVSIRTGDIVVGDRDGVAIVAASRAADTLRDATAREAKEAGFRLAIRHGESTVDLLALGDRLQASGLF